MDTRLSTDQRFSARFARTIYVVREVFMRKVVLFVFVLFCVRAVEAADWLTDGGDVQRTGWQKNEKILNKENVHGLQVLWQAKLDTKPREMHTFLPTLVVDSVQTASGVKQLAITAAISDDVFANDVATGKLVWKQHFEYTPVPTARPGGELCPGGQTATPTIGPSDASGKRILYALDGAGMLHELNIADGKEIEAPVKFGWPNGKHYALNLWGNYLFTTTAQGCGSNPNQVWAIDLTDPSHQVMTFNPGSGGLWGRRGAAMTSDGIAYAPTGDGIYDPEDDSYGNGLIGVQIDGRKLKLKNYYIPSEWAFMKKRDLDMNVTPAIFNYNGRELMVTSSKECRIWLLDTHSPGGADHQTPLYRSPLVCNRLNNFANAGIWGAMTTWQDAEGTRWILTPYWGPVHPDLQIPHTNGSVMHGGIMAFKLENKSGALQLTPVWVSRDMNMAEPPVVANGVVYAYGSGADESQATDMGVELSAGRRIPNSTHAMFYALNAETGAELFSSGDQLKSFIHFGGISVANGRIYLGTYDGVLYSFGLPSK